MTSRPARLAMPTASVCQASERLATRSMTSARVPFAKIGQAFRDWRFLVTVLTVNFVAVPIVVYVLSRIVAHDQVLLIGVLFVLLAPCVDYVIVFTGIAGGAKDRLLAAAPLLMLAQMLLLPLYLWLLVGAVRSLAEIQAAQPNAAYVAVFQNWLRPAGAPSWCGVARLPG